MSFAGQDSTHVCTIELTCKRPVFAVALDAQHIKGIFTDNLFDLRPTAQKIVHF